MSEYLTMQIAACGRSQLEIAEMCGFAKDKANMISMMKAGRVKVPRAKITVLAKAIGVDPMVLFRMCVAEYEPELLEVVDSLRGQPALTANEVAIIQAIRGMAPHDPGMTTEAQRRKLGEFVRSLG